MRSERWHLKQLKQLKILKRIEHLRMLLTRKRMEIKGETF